MSLPMVQWRRSHWQHCMLECECGEELSEADLVLPAALRHRSSGMSQHCAAGSGEVFILLDNKGTVDSLCWLITCLEVVGAAILGIIMCVFPSIMVGPSYLPQLLMPLHSVQCPLAFCHKVKPLKYMRILENLLLGICPKSYLSFLKLPKSKTNVDWLFVFFV